MGICIQVKKILHLAGAGRGLIVAFKDHKPFLLAILCLQNSVLTFKNMAPKPIPTIPHYQLFREQSSEEVQSRQTHQGKSCFFCSPWILSQQLSTGWAVLVCSCSERIALFQAWPRCPLPETQPKMLWKLLGQQEEGDSHIQWQGSTSGRKVSGRKHLQLQASPSLGDLMTAKLWRQKPSSSTAYSQSHLGSNFENYCLEKSSSKTLFSILLMKNNKNQQLKTSLEGALEKIHAIISWFFQMNSTGYEVTYLKANASINSISKAVSLLR